MQIRSLLDTQQSTPSSSHQSTAEVMKSFISCVDFTLHQLPFRVLAAELEEVLMAVTCSVAGPTVVGGVTSNTDDTGDPDDMTARCITSPELGRLLGPLVDESDA